MRAAMCLLIASAALLAPSSASAQCTGGAACPPCTSCRVAPASGSNPTVAEMATLFDQIAAGPSRYGSLGWDFGGNNTIGSGSGWCGGSGARDTVQVSFPCVLLKAIYVTESNWRQFCSTGQTVISFDCGYGIAQVTSGMRRGETSAYDPNRVASSAAYNVSVGAAILAGKWRASPCVGNNDPQIIEDWYFPVWGYNGFSFRNNPNNPMYSASRPEFRTPGVASAQTRGNYPYQELVWGYVHYPPSSQHYTGVALAYPNRAEICASCGLPTASISEPAGSHRGGCTAAPPVDVVVRDASEPDAPLDAARDVTVDAPRDVVSDVGTDAVRDVARDAVSDVVVRDVTAPDVIAPDASADEEYLSGNCSCSSVGTRRASSPALLAWALALGVTASWCRRARRRRGCSAAPTRSE